MKRVKSFIAILLALVLCCQTNITVKAADHAKVTGKVVEVQKYGNLTMDIKPKELYDAGLQLGDLLNVTVGDQTLEIPFCTSYSDVETGSLVVRDAKADDRLVVAINMGNFSTTYNVKVGDALSFELKEKEGYLSEYLLHQLTRTNNRSDYSTDSIFANFRNISTTGMANGVLYRSASPINNEIGRAAYANKLAKAVGIKTVLNLADSDSNITEYISGPDFDSDYYKDLYDNGNVITLNMGVDLSSSEFGTKLAEGLRFMTSKEAPYLVHCTEGKDRAGFVSALLEALQGASYDEIVTDYMTTYENYYHVEKGSEQYQAVAESNIVTSLTTIVCKQPKGTDISKMNLKTAAEEYLIGIGLTREEITALQAKLSQDVKESSFSIAGKVTEIEKYGHAVTDILIDDFEKLSYKYGDMITVRFGNGFILEAPYLDGYYVNNGDPLVRAYPGQTNIAICINYGKLSEIANVKVGDSVTLTMSEPEGYLIQYEIRQLKRSNEREDYASDEVFANFRPITMGKIAEGVLYRSASPVNNEINRAAYADALMKKAGVNTVVNLADSIEDIKSYMEEADYASPYYKTLYEDGKVLPLNMGLNFSSDEFKQSVVQGLQFMIKGEAPYLFHCTEGKDRAGFYAALLEALMGANQNEIISDYLLSYANYYSVKPDSIQAEVISQDVIAMLYQITGTKDLTTMNLTNGAKSYLISGGMTEEEIASLVKKLSTPVKTQAAEEVVEEKEEQEVVTYTVRKGDSLWKIAKKQLGNPLSYSEIYDLNKDIIKNPNMIMIGQLLKLPKKAA